MYIEKINSPKDLKALSLDELEKVAKEVREAVLFRISKKGGHMGSNLAVVELTVAMTYAFDFPKDKVVFDVSHQTYPYKILTGRAYGFMDEKRLSEISGFSSPEESPEYDVFKVGHTSTSVALAAGLQKARDMLGGNERIIAFIGDGSLSGGEAFEGLDIAAEIGSNIIVIVNDNEMSIPENHGGIYENLKILRETLGEAKLNYFKSLGFDYVYVEEGHDIKSLVSAFEKIKDSDHPIVVHVHTIKGYGYEPAMKDKEGYHHAVPFDLKKGNGAMSFDDFGECYPALLGKYVAKKAKEDEKVVIVATGAPGATGLPPKVRQPLGSQYIDVGIAEECATALISGLAKGGMKPIWNTYGTFIQRAYDQLVQDLCINGNSAVINLAGCSIFGMGSITHICFFDIAMLSHIPNLVYIAPTTWEEFVAMEDWAIDQDKYPVAIRLPHVKVVHSEEKYDTDYSKLNTYKMVKKGSRVAIIALGGFFQKGESVTEKLLSFGIDATLINPRFISGVDEKLLEELKKDHELIVTLEDGCLDGGFGERISRFYGPSNLKVLNFGVEKALYDGYDLNELLEKSHLKDDLIVSDIIKTLG